VHTNLDIKQYLVKAEPVPSPQPKTPPPPCLRAGRFIALAAADFDYRYLALNWHLSAQQAGFYICVYIARYTYHICINYISGTSPSTGISPRSRKVSIYIYIYT